MLKIQKEVVIGISVFILCVICLGNNYTVFTTDYGERNFDTWSENIMIADLNYYENYGGNTAFLKNLYPGCIVNDGHTIIYPEEIYMTYIEGKKYKQEDYGNYTSNLCLHRYGYRIIQKIMGANENCIRFLHFINISLLSAVCVALMYWIKRYTNIGTASLLMIILVLFSPNFVMYAKNLYWAIWSLFIPMLGSIFMCNIGRKRGKFPLRWCMVTTFITCVFKQLFYFEFLSTVMISLIIPYTMYFGLENREKYNLKRICINLGCITISAIMSFLFISCIKVGVLFEVTGSVGEALNQYIGPIIYRLVGESNSTVETISESAKVSLINVLLLMLSKPFLSVRKTLFFSHLFTTSLFALTAALALKNRKNKEILGLSNKMFMGWMINMGLAWTAPVSWFILAKPHTYVHNLHCSFLWYLPFSIMMLAFYIFLISKKGIEVFEKNNLLYLKIRKHKKILCLLGIGIVICSCLFEGVKKYSIYKEATEIINKGDRYFIHSINGEIFSKKGRLCISMDSGQQTVENFFVHVYTYGEENEFQNKDYIYDNNEVEKVEYSGKKIVLLDVENEKINRIVLGQYNPYTGDRVWEEQIFISEEYQALDKIECANITDENWKNGLSLNGNVLCVDNIREEYLDLEGKQVIINGTLQNQIVNVEFADEKYAYFYLKNLIDINSIPDEEIEIQILK